MVELAPTDIKVNRENTKAEISKVSEWLGEILNVAKINPRIIKRLELLNSMTNFIEEEKESLELAKKLFKYYETAKPEKIFTREEKDEVLIGLILADIGKSGPPNATESQQALIIRIFGVEGVKDLKTPVRDFIEDRFPDTAQRDIQLFRDIGLDPSMSIEKFWRLHSGWTLGIVEGDGIPEEDLPGAVLHHILEGDNVDLIDEEGNYKTLNINGKVKLRFGENRRFDRPEKLVPLLDKYEAILTRLEGKTHDDAISFLKKTLSKNERFKSDLEFIELIEDLDQALTNVESVLLHG